MLALVFGGIVLAAKVFADIDLGTDDWFDAVLFGMHVEFDRPVQSGCVGERESGHFEFLGALEQVVDFGQGSQERVVGVGVEVSKHTFKIQNKGRTTDLMNTLFSIENLLSLVVFLS